MFTPDMQIICPNCSTAYEVPDSVFGGRSRKLRCVQCGHQWKVGPTGTVVEGAEAAPAAPAATPWPVDRSEAGPSAESANQFLVSREQRFGHPTEQSAPAEFERAHAEAQPAQEANEQDQGPGTTPDEHDGFYDLVLAARNRAIEVEPEPPPPPKLRITSAPFFAVLVVLFLLGLVLLEHRLVVRLIPASAGLFGRLGL